MPSKYPVCTPKDVIRVLERYGFSYVSQKGSHAKYKDGVNVTIIPMHSKLAKGTLKSILAQAGISLEDFMKVL